MKDKGGRQSNNTFVVGGQVIVGVDDSPRKKPTSVASVALALSFPLCAWGKRTNEGKVSPPCVRVYVYVFVCVCVCQELPLVYGMW